MKLLHLTPKRHYNSILKHGLQPSKIKLDHHLNAFNNDGLEGDKAIYLFNPDEGCSVMKVIDDFIYCKSFIHPRNEMVTQMGKINENLRWEEYYDDVNWINFRKLGTRLYGEDEDYVLLELESKNIEMLEHDYYHQQSGGGDDYGSCVMMKEQYEHDDKLLHIATKTIDSKHLKLIGEVSSRLYKDDTIGTTYKSMK